MDKKYRSMGIGRRLLDMYHGIHRDYKSFTLWCDDENQAAIALYCSNQLGGVLVIKMSTSTITFTSVRNCAHNTSIWRCVYAV